MLEKQLFWKMQFSDVWEKDALLTSGVVSRSGVGGGSSLASPEAGLLARGITVALGSQMAAEWLLGFWAGRGKAYAPRFTGRPAYLHTEPIGTASGFRPIHQTRSSAALVWEIQPSLRSDAGSQAEFKMNRWTLLPLPSLLTLPSLSLSLPAFLRQKPRQSSHLLLVHSPGAHTCQETRTQSRCPMNDQDFNLGVGHAAHGSALA